MIIRIETKKGYSVNNNQIPINIKEKTAERVDAFGRIYVIY